MENKNNIIQTRDAKKIVASIDNLVENQEKKVIKQIYRCFIEKITFNSRTKSDIQLTLKFDEEIINQLNTLYKRAVSSNVDTALFAYKASFRLNI